MSTKTSNKGPSCRANIHVKKTTKPARHDYHCPKTLEEAWELKTKNPSALFIAGGTDVMTRIKDRVILPPALISLRSIAGLSDIELSGSDMRIGALATITDLMSDTNVKQHLPVLVDGAQVLGSTQVRNAATVGGNLCNASPCADTATPLLVLDARVELKSPGGRREVALEDFFTGPGETVLETDEVMTAILVPLPGTASKGRFMNKGRAKLDITKVSIAAQLELDGNKCREIKVAAGSAAPTPLRLKKVEDLLRGKELSQENLARAKELAKEEVSPITDIRSTEEYRRELAGVMLGRIITQILERDA